MDVLKKVYKVIMALTIISIVLLCCITLEWINITNETGKIISTLAAMIFLISILFSRNANIVANRKNNLIAWGVTFILLLYVLIFVLQLIFKFEITSDIQNILKGLLITLTVIILIFEIPQANSFHGGYQKFIVLLTIITFFIGVSYYNKKENAYKKLEETWDYVEYTSDIEELDKMQKAFTVSLLITIGTFIINPMLRVHYLDIDYSNVDEIDEILTNKHQYQGNNFNTNPNKIIEQKYTKANQPKMPTPSAPAPIAEVTTPVVELPHEKVVNPNFKQDDLPEAVIPSIIVNQPNSNPTSTTENVNDKPVIESTPQPTITKEQVTPVQNPVITPTVEEPSPNTTETAQPPIVNQTTQTNNNQ